MEFSKLKLTLLALTLMWVAQFTLPASKCFALNVTLAWEPNEESNVEGYFVCHKQGSEGDPDQLATYETIIKVPINDRDDPNSLTDPSKPEFTITGLDENETNYFAVAAFGAGGVSRGSREVLVLGSDRIPAQYRNDYDRAWGISKGDLEGFMFLYNSSERVVPTLGPSQDLPAFDLNGYERIGFPLNLSVEPSQASGFTFDVPVTLLIPIPDGYDAEGLSIGVYESVWILAWEEESNSQEERGEWLVFHPVLHAAHPAFSSSRSVIELVVKHFSGIQLARFQNYSVEAGGGGEAGGGCFMLTVMEIR